MSWTKLRISSGSGARNGVALAQLQERFWNWYAPNAVERSHQRGALPTDVAMFSLHDPDGGDVIVYFTPNSAEFVHQHEGIEPCAPPTLTKYLELNVGDQSAWDLVADAGDMPPSASACNDSA